MLDEIGQPEFSGHPPLSRRRKAAIIVRLLLSEGAELPLGALPGHLQSALTEEIGAMRYIDGGTLRAVVGEFLEALEQVGLTFPGGIDGALNLLDGHISAEASAELRAANFGTPRDPWPSIAAADIDKLLPLVRAESTEVAAVLLSKIASAKAAEILGRLPGDHARRIACSVSLTSAVSPETVSQIGQALHEQLAQTPKPAFPEPAAARMGAILNLSPADTREAVLSALDSDDATFAAGVRKAIFTFADIPARLSPGDVPAVVRGLPGEVLTIALAGADRAEDKQAARFVLDNLSRRMAEQIRDEIEEHGPVRPRDAEAAMSQVVQAIRAQADSGEIVLDMGEEDDA